MVVARSALSPPNARAFAPGAKPPTPPGSKAPPAPGKASGHYLLRFALARVMPIVLAIALTMIANPVRAQTPFACTGDLYQVQS